MEATESARDKQKISTKQITEAQKKLTQITELETEAQAEEAIFVEETAEAERELAAGKTALDDATIELTAALEAQNKANTRTTVATEAEAKAEKNLAEAKAAQAKNSVIITNQQELENAQTERSILLKQRAAAATKLLVGAIAIAALVLIAAKIADISNHIKELNENVKKSKEEFEKAYGKTQVDTSKFDELYEKYKETGKVTDELKQASETLGEQLDITAYKARLAAGDFNGLAKSIHEASEESYGMAEQAANNFFSDITAATTYSPLEDLFDIDSTIGTIFGPSDPLQAAKQAGVHEYFKDIEQKAKEKGTEASMVVPYLQDE